MKIKKILIANRGEIVVRVIKACKELGIKAAAIYSDADKTALHARYADESYCIGGMYPSESYLDGDRIIALAKKIDAQAIHPGYGFLSENPRFIQKVEESGLIFIGPSYRSVEMMGSKTAARELMKRNKVPIVPGTIEPITDIEVGMNEAEAIGFPVLLKASAGGGGKGMKKVYSREEFIPAFDSAKREAKKAFGDDAVYIEKLIENPKHIEVQVIADKHGNYAHLFERECSVQRRHQKVIEEAPSPFVDEKTRLKITAAAVDAAKACNYYNAGTIEFLMDKNKDFYFLEMNTRLQVEHPITELITGIDLVREQIRIAEGEKLSFKQEDLKILCHAVEARVYAENPDDNFLPTTGKVEYHRLPTGPGIRSDRGIEVGSEVSVYYDPLLTKLATFGKTRESAINRMKIALSSYLIAGVSTNIAFLNWILEQEKFLDGSYTINFLDEDFTPLIPDKWKEGYGEKQKRAALVFSALYAEKFKNDSVKTTKQKSCENNLWVKKLYE